MRRKYSDLKIAQTYSRDYVITEEMGQAFAAVSGDHNPVHLDEEYAEKTRFGRKIVHGMLLGSFISGILGQDFPGEGTIYLNQNLRFERPVFYGDTITITIEVLELNDEKCRITLGTNCVNQNGKTVISGVALVMLQNE